MSIQTVQTVLASSRHLLFLDAIGALVTCLITGWLFASDWVPTGLPSEILWVLAAIAGVLFLTSLTSFLFAAKPSNILRYTAIANAAYGVATLAICAMKMKMLTRWGITYFPLEAALLMLLASWEWRVSRMSNVASSEMGRHSEAIAHSSHIEKKD
jgi:hypothetical protein